MNVQTNDATTITTLALASITIDRAIQVRECIDEDAVQAYAEARSNGAVLPPIVVFKETEGLGSMYWLADGFHRIESAKRSNATTVRAEVHEGTRRDAMLYAIGANAAHGLRRSNADKRRAVEMLLADDEWGGMSDRWIAETAHVSDHLVADVRKQLEVLPTETKAQVREHAPENGDANTKSDEPGTRTGRDGKQYRRARARQRTVIGRIGPEWKPLPKTKAQVLVAEVQVEMRRQVPEWRSSWLRAKIEELHNVLHTSTPAVPPELQGDQFASAWERWVQYRREARNALTPSTIECQYALLAKLGVDEAIARIERSITNGWTGLDFPADRKGQQGSIVKTEAARTRRADKAAREFPEDTPSIRRI